MWRRMKKKAGRVYEAVKNKISYFDLVRIYKVYLSNDPQKENKILDYVVFGFKKDRLYQNFTAAVLWRQWNP